MTQNSTEYVITFTTANVSQQVMNARSRRSSFIIQNNNSAAMIYVSKGINSIDATTPAALKLLPSAHMVESNSDAFTCWPGAVQVMTDTNGAQVTILETWED